MLRTASTWFSLEAILMARATTWHVGCEGMARLSLRLVLGSGYAQVAAYTSAATSPISSRETHQVPSAPSMPKS